MKRIIPFILLGLVPFTATAATTVVKELLTGYETQSAVNFSAERGKAMWNETHATREGNISCATCHGTDLTKGGKHVRTGKPIEPMAPSVNAERLTDPAKIEKWLLRNCKGTLGRECTAQEKGDFLTYIQTN